MEIFGLVLNTGIAILANVFGGIFFSKFVQKKMLQSSLREGTGSVVSNAVDIPAKLSKQSLDIDEITREKTIRPESVESVFCYENIRSANFLKILFLPGVLAFLVAAPLSFFYVRAKGDSFLFAGTYAAFTLFFAFLLFKYILRLLKAKRISKNLVVLRVFGSRTNTQYLFNRIVSFWNFIGPSFTIMDPVYARHEFAIIRSPKNFKLKLAQIGAPVPGAIFVYFYPFGNALWNYLFLTGASLFVFFGFVFLVSSSMFVRDARFFSRIINRKARSSKTWYGIGKQINLYCYDNIWRKALVEMLGRADVVIMDLRGFARERKGCSFEMAYLVNNFSLEKILFLIDQRTDRNLVLDTLQIEAHKMSENSPNAGKKNLPVTVYSCEKQDWQDTEQIIRILCNKAGAKTENIAREGADFGRSRLPLISVPSYVLMPVLIPIVLHYALLVLFFCSYFFSMELQYFRFFQGQNFEVAPPPPPLAKYALAPVAVATSDPEPHFVSVTISLGYAKNEELAVELENRSGQIAHMLNILLSQKKYGDMVTVEQKIELAQEIKNQINVPLISGKIEEVYIEKFFSD